MKGGGRREGGGEGEGEGVGVEGGGGGKKELDNVAAADV